MTSISLRFHFGFALVPLALGSVGSPAVPWVSFISAFLKPSLRVPRPSCLVEGYLLIFFFRCLKGAMETTGLGRIPTKQRILLELPPEGAAYQLYWKALLKEVYDAWAHSGIPNPNRSVVENHYNKSQSRLGAHEAIQLIAPKGCMAQLYLLSSIAKTGPFVEQV